MSARPASRAPHLDWPGLAPHLTPLMEEPEKVQLEGPSCEKQVSQRTVPGNKKGAWGWKKG